MKPKLFIGSSSEALEVANAIQENLTHDAEVTVWNQGIFKLSSTSLNDLVSAVGKSNYAIFVFNPDDIGIIREQKHSTVRDNVIFELGLFIGKLGQGNVYYLIPENETIHLPTDLLGVNPGLYNSRRSDKNLLAALGPFCNQVRSQLKEFKYINLEVLHEESESAKRIAVDQPFGYEYLLLAELIESRLSKINKMHQNLRNGVYFVRSIHVTAEEYHRFFQDTLEEFQRLIKIFSHLVTDGIKTALGPDGVPSKFIDLKILSDEFLNLSTELFNWEARNEQLVPPDGLTKAKDLFRGTSDVINTQMNILPSEIRRVIKANQEPNKISSECVINLKLELPPQIEQVLAVFQDYYGKKGYL
jgi:hypothetical protein